MINDDSGIDGFLSPKYVRHLPQNTLCPHIIGPNSRGGMDGYRKIGDICGGGGLQYNFNIFRLWRVRGIH